MKKLNLILIFSWQLFAMEKKNPKIDENIELRPEKKYIREVLRLTSNPKLLAIYRLCLYEQLETRDVKQNSKIPISKFIREIKDLIPIRARLVKGFKPGAYSFEWSHDDQNILVSGMDGGELLDLRDKNDAKLISKLEHNSYYKSALWSLDNNYAFCCGDSDIFIWDMTDKHNPKKIGSLNGCLFALSPDEKYGLTSFKSDYPILWNLAKDIHNPQQITELKISSSREEVGVVSWNPKNNYIFFGIGNNILLFDLDIMQEIRRSSFINSAIRPKAIRWSKDGHCALILFQHFSGYGSRVDLYDLRSSNKEPIRTINLSDLTSYRDYYSYIKSAEWGFNSNYALISLDDGSNRPIYFWDLTDKKISMKELMNGSLCQAWSHDRNYCITGDNCEKYLYHVGLGDNDSIAMELAKLPETTDGLLAYILIKHILKNKNEGNQFLIYYAKTKFIFNKIPKLLRDFFIENKYVELRDIKKK